ncbi:MAG: Asp-tRNA(Asn)/Glu-tRNA(Gln) amidotransferase subunit GatC [Anaerolineae bacterium]
MSQHIDKDLVQHIALLTRLALTEEETALFSEQFSAIIDYFAMLGEVDVAAVAPFTQPQITRAELREDVAQPSMAREDFLANVPQRQGNAVRVSVVLENLSAGGDGSSAD